jgi:hypothetical protein
VEPRRIGLHFVDRKKLSSLPEWWLRPAVEKMKARPALLIWWLAGGGLVLSQRGYGYCWCVASCLLGGAGQLAQRLVLHVFDVEAERLGVSRFEALDQLL